VACLLLRIFFSDPSKASSPDIRAVNRAAKAGKSETCPPL
jgi:hypothetical protein